MLELTACTKIKDIYSNPLICHSTRGDMLPSCLTEGLTTEVFDKRIGLDPKNKYWSRNWYNNWTREFVSAFPSLQDLKNVSDRIFEYEHNLVNGFNDLELYNKVVLLIDPKVRYFTPQEWLKLLGNPKHLRPSFKRKKLEENRWDPEEVNIRWRISPQLFRGVVVGDENGFRVFYKPGFDISQKALYKAGLISNPWDLENLSRITWEEWVQMENSFWRTHQQEISSHLRNKHYLSEIEVVELSSDEMKKLASIRVQHIVEKSRCLWTQKPYLALPIYGSSGDLYWPERVPYQELRKTTMMAPHPAHLQGV